MQPSKADHDLPAFDSTGRALPLPAEEVERRASAAVAAFEAMASIGDEEEQRETYDLLAEAINQDRPADRRWPLG